jgi:hypothetical protein
VKLFMFHLMPRAYLPDSSGGPASTSIRGAVVPRRRAAAAPDPGRSAAGKAPLAHGPHREPLRDLQAWMADHLDADLPERAYSSVPRKMRLATLK